MPTEHYGYLRCYTETNGHDLASCGYFTLGQIHFNIKKVLVSCEFLLHAHANENIENCERKRAYQILFSSFTASSNTNDVSKRGRALITVATNDESSS